MKRTAKANLYAAFEEKIQGHRERGGAPEEEIRIGEIVFRLRRERGLSGAELCRKAGGFDPRTLAAIEKGRIKNPSIRMLQMLARGLEIAVSDFFRRAELDHPRYCFSGTKKGFYYADFPAWGTKVISLTPFIKNFFCGKIILAPRKSLSGHMLKHSAPMFVSILVGCFEVTVGNKSFSLREGDNLFFDGAIEHSFRNPIRRDSVFLVVTAPSFF
jgi:transcriptional regulator with XRE-family HTH domain